MDYKMLAPVMTMILIAFGGGHQIYLIWKKKNSDQISIIKTAFGLANGFAWIMYGSQLDNPYLHACNYVAAVFGLSLFAAVLVYRHPKFKSPHPQ